jgi:hypothetical protein
LSFLGLAHEPVEQFEAATVGARAALVSIEHTRYESVDQQPTANQPEKQDCA